MQVNQAVRTMRGVPKKSDFASRFCTPIIIDITTGFAYYMNGNTVYPLQTAPASVIGAFSSGFSKGFS